MFIAIDIGATKTAVAGYKTLNFDSQIKTLQFPTYPLYQEEFAQLIHKIHEVSGGAKIEGIGLALAAQIDDSGNIITKSNLPDYFGHNLKRDLSKIFTLPLATQNDAVCAARAELLSGYHPSVLKLLHLVWGTGFGGAFILKSGKQFFTLPLEPGWTIVQPGGMPHTHSQVKGTLEAYVAGNQLEAQLGQPIKNLPDNHRIWQQATTTLSIFLYNTLQLFHPDKIILSGGIIQYRPFLLTEIEARLQAYKEVVTIPPISLTSFENPCLPGALSLLT